MGAHRYVGFISYAHADEGVAKRLHTRLETYKLPKDLTSVHKTLTPIFRDTAELTAHHSLSEKIKEALQGTRFLIVLCSPAAKASFWVNEEIRLFRELHGEASILCALIDGTPETAFPPALTEHGQEPLAANLSGGREGFRLGTTQLAASMFGVGLDQLVRRDTQRRKKQVQLFISTALIFSGFMGITAYSAIQARNAAITNRAEAESLVEYMIGDLKNELVPEGRLDILDGMGEMVKTYYDNSDIAKMPNARVFRYARALHLLAQADIDAGNYDSAKEYALHAASLTQRALTRDQTDTDALYTHAQSQYWLGAVEYKKGNFRKAFPLWQDNASLAEKLLETNSTNIKWVLESAYSANNIALLHNRLSEFTLSEIAYNNSIDYFNQALSLEPENAGAIQSLANAYAGAARVALISSTLDKVQMYREKQFTSLEQLLAKDPQNMPLKYRLALAQVTYLNDIGITTEDLPRDPLSQSALKQLAQLVNHEPENDDWAKTFKHHNYTVLAARQRNGTNAPSIAEFDKFISYMKANSNASGTSLVLEAARIRRHIAAGDLTLANNKLKEISATQLTKEPDLAKTLKELHLFMMLNLELNQHETAAAFANKLLRSKTYTQEQNYPSDLIKKVEALNVIGSCEEAQNLKEALITRGYGASIDMAACYTKK